MSLSNSPTVFGFVSINAATLPSSAFASALKSVQPRRSTECPCTLKPHRAALAGFVPCAASGITTILRCAFAALRVVRFHHHHGKQFAMRSGGRAAASWRPCRRFPPASSAIRRSAASAPCARLLGLQRVEAGKARHARRLLIDLRVVLHRAGTERIEAEINGIIAVRQVREMAHDIQFGDFRKGRSSRRFSAAQAACAGSVCGTSHSGSWPPAPGPASLKNQWLIFSTYFISASF